jgi:hypothetical protein
MNRAFMMSFFACRMVSIANAQEANSSTTAEPSSLKAYDNYDFVPGEKIIFADDFSDDSKGEFPAWLCRLSSAIRGR